MSGGNFKLGLFVVVGVGLLVLALLLLGVLERARPSVTVETYFGESIQNLVPGAPVKYRGMVVGRVSRITFLSMVYPEARGKSDDLLENTIFVEMKVGAGLLRRLHLENLREHLPVAVERGLRLRLATSGLGGPTFIELAYVDPTTNPVTPLTWTPRNPHIPTIPSTVTMLIDSLAAILGRLADPSMLDDLAAVLDAGAELDKILLKLEAGDTLDSLASSLRDLADAGKSLEQEFQGDKLAEVVDDAAAVLRSARQMLEDEGPEGVRPLIRDLGSMADRLETAAAGVDDVVRQIEQTGMLDDLEKLAADLGPAGQELGDMASRLNRLLSQNESNISEMIQSLRRVTLQLQSLLEEAEQNPSRLIFGDPPPRRVPGDSR